MFEPMLDGVHELVVISPNVNYLSPLEVMIDDRGSSLGDRFSISYSPSALHFATAPDPDRGGRTSGRWSALLVHPPGSPGSRARVGGLDMADREIANLASHVRRSRILAGPDASEARLRRLASSDALSGVDLIHIASHGLTSNRFARDTWLSLAEAVRGDAGVEVPADRDGFLTMSDLEHWRLDARLVTLASCQSAGTWQAHAQGVLGLGQAFQNAGARSAVVSLWPVEEAAVERFMSYFYAALFETVGRPCSIADAMRTARRQLRDHRDANGRQRFAHPVHWAGFVLMGDPG
jgi:CHAT domain-containing protein